MMKTPGWKKKQTWVEKFRKEIGLIYRGYIGQVFDFFVDGLEQLPVDPLFLDAAARWHTTPTNSYKAEAVPTVNFQIESERGNVGTVRVRASILPMEFNLKDPSVSLDGRSKKHRDADRWWVMDKTNGIIITRKGRQIQVVNPPFTVFQNLDRYLKVELDFDPELDEYFGITTTKQHIRISEEFWNKLNQATDLQKLIASMRSRRNELNGEFSLKKLQEAEQTGSGDGAITLRASEVAMAETADFDDAPAPITEELKQEVKENIEEEVAKERTKNPISPEEAAKRVENRIKAKVYEVAFEATPEGPLYRPILLGEGAGSKKVVINTAHPFNQRAYMDAPADVQATIETLYMTLCGAELTSNKKGRAWYGNERSRWARRLAVAMKSLKSDSEMRDLAAMMAEDDEAGLDDMSGQEEADDDA